VGLERSLHCWNIEDNLQPHG
jgi:hypothetical protein